MLSFYFESQNIYGLPERADYFPLNTTKGRAPYRLYSVDKFPHLEFDPGNLYSGIPYVMGHGMDGSHDEAVAWMSAAETYVDIYEDPMQPLTSRTVNFITEGGMMEFFLLGASNPKSLQKRLATVTGFPTLPPFFSLGFHYSRWEETSSQRIIEYNDKFEEHGFPLDVLWMDLGYTLDNEYFVFNLLTFNQKDVELMRSIINVSDRRLVVITDPHIKFTESYKVYKKGLYLDRLLS